MFKWEKLGRIYNPFDYPDRPDWMFEYALAPSTLELGETLRVYFGCRPPRGQDQQVVTYTGFVDLNIENLFEIQGLSALPVLTLGDTGCFDEFGTYPMSFLQRESDILAYYAGWTRAESVPFNVAIGAAVSTDGGKTFDRLGPGPAIPFTQDEPFVMSGPKLRRFGDKYYLFYIAGREWITVNGRKEISHRIRMASSADGVNWTKQNQDLVPPYWAENESQASPDVFFAAGVYHMFFCGWVPETFRQTRTRTIGYAWSKDLINWTRDDSQAGINVASEGWDSEMVAYPHVFDIKGQVYMLYIGNEVGRYGFGLAKLSM
jgi:hypothetical protein